MMNLETCPWCGVAAVWSDPEGGRSGYARWGCGSSKVGDEPTQHRSCRINELEAKVERLQAIVDELPTNGSGTPVVPGSKQFFVAYTGQTVCVEARRFLEAGGVGDILTDWGWQNLAKCFDSLEEAEAAEAAGGE